MATYSQWRKAADEGTVKRLTWVCGDQRVLVEEVVDFIRTALGVSDMTYSSVVAGAVPDREIWAQVNQYPFDPTAKRLVVVREAEKIKRWAPLQDWIANSRLLPTVHILFVSSESEFPYVVKENKTTTELKPHAGWIRDASMGTVINCALPSAVVGRNKQNEPVRPGPPDIVLWVQRHASCSEKVAEYLLERSGSNLGLAFNVCKKAALFQGQLTEGVIDLLCTENPAVDFTDNVVRLNRRKALVALEGLPYKEYGRSIGLLDNRLDLLAKLNAALRQKMTLREMGQLPDMPMFLARSYVGVAKHYDPGRVTNCRRVLAVADDALRSGARDAVLESVCALW